MSNRDGKPELNRIEKMIEEESDPKQRAILVLLHYLKLSISTSMDKLSSHDCDLNHYKEILDKANGASLVFKIFFGLSHAAILSLIIAATSVALDVRDTVTRNSVRISALETSTANISAQVFRYNEGSVINQEQIIKNQH